MMIDQAFPSRETLKRYLIEKYFKKKSIFGNRDCKLFWNYRINSKGILEKMIGVPYKEWSSASWKDFNTRLQLYFEKEARFSRDNDISKLNWDFK